MTNKTKGNLLKVCSLAVDIVPPVIATLTQFPIWVERSASATVSGTVLILAFLCIIPLWKKVKSMIKSPSAPIIWAIAFIGMTIFRNITDEMVLVAFIGMISNLLGVPIYKIGESIASKDDTATATTSRTTTATE